MSSHHVVREAQEPALLVLDPEHISDPALAPLLEWSPTIITLANVFTPLTENGLKVDVLIASQDQLPALLSLLESQAPVHTIIIKPAEDSLSAAFGYLASKKHQAVNVLSRTEQLQAGLTEQLAMQEHGLNIVVLDGQERYALCRTGQFSKWLPAGEKIYVRPAAAPGSISTTGFQRKLDKAPLQEPISLETIQAGRVHIEASCPIWVVESIT